MCPGGDASASYYDGSCGESTETAGFTTQAVKKTDTAHDIAGTIDHIALIKERKAKIEGVKDIKLNVPLAYRVKLKKVDVAMDDWLDKGSVERQVKLLRLYKKIQLLKERVSNEKSRAILGYVEEKLISLLDRKLLEK